MTSEIVKLAHECNFSVQVISNEILLSMLPENPCNYLTRQGKVRGLKTSHSK